MLHKCANPDCSSPFRNISQGKLFHIAADLLPATPKNGLDRPPRAIEHYWLCDKCTATFTLVASGETGLSVVPLPVLRKPVQAATDWRRFNEDLDNLGENWELRRAWR
jgi:hypothetical protein